MQTGHFHGVTRSEVGLRYLPRPDALLFDFPDTHVALVTDEGGALTQVVAAELAQRGYKTVLLALPGIAPRAGQTCVSLAEVSDTAIQQAISTISSQYGEVGLFIHLHPYFEFQHGQFAQHFAAERQWLKAVFFLAKHLQKPLNALGRQQGAAFLTVSRLDGQQGLANPGNVSILSGGLAGLVKSLNLEWAPVFCRAVDLQPQLPYPVMASQVIAELCDADTSLLHTGYSASGRTTIVATPVAVPEQQTIHTTVTPASVFLVSGGAKGVTATCVLEMAKVFQCKFVLLGRSSSDFELPAYAQSGMEEGALKRLIMEDLKARGEAPNLAAVKSLYNKIVSKQEIEDTLHGIRQAGAQAIYVQADVTQAAQTQAAVAQATAQLGPITGILHGAGLLADKLIVDKTERDFDSVLSVKLDGLLSLLRCVKPDELQHLLLFSSVAGFYGNVGQSDYAMANEILSKAAHLFKKNHPHTHVSAINWGAWDAGMVSGALKKLFEEAGVSLVNSQGGAAMLINELSTAYSQQPQVVIGGTLPAAESHLSDSLLTHRVQRQLHLADNPFLLHHVIQGHAVLPVVNAVGWMAQTAARLYPDYRVAEIKNTRLFKGIVFDGSEATDYTLVLQETAKSREQIAFEVTVQSPGSKLPVYHYKAEVVLLHKRATQDAPTVQHAPPSGFVPQPGAALYTNGALFHGRYFQGIEQILDWTEQGITLACCAPPVPLDAQGQFPAEQVNTFFADIQYQGMVIWVQRYHEGAKSLPLQTDAVTLYRPVPFGLPLFVRVDVVESNDFKMVANCTVYDEAGVVYMHTTHAAVTVSKGLTW